MKLILLRHGETQENVDGIVQGWTDTKLNEVGTRQASIASQKFSEPIDAIYSSDLKRCVQTAKYFKHKYQGIPYFEDRRLRERNFGDAQGTHRDLHDWEVFWESKDTVSITNAETLNEYSDRVEDFLGHLRANNRHSKKILIVTHGGTINRILDILSISSNYKAINNCESLIVDLN